MGIPNTFGLKKTIGSADKQEMIDLAGKILDGHASKGDTYALADLVLKNLE